MIYRDRQRHLTLHDSHCTKTGLVCHCTSYMIQLPRLKLATKTLSLKKHRLASDFNSTLSGSSDIIRYYPFKMKIKLKDLYDNIDRLETTYVFVPTVVAWPWNDGRTYNAEIRTQWRA